MDLLKIKDIIDSMMELEYFDDERNTIFNLEDFICCTEDHSIMDYDGFGYVLYKDKEISNADVWTDEQLVIFSNEEDDVIAFSLYLLEKIYGNDIKICWYNK